MRRKKRQFEASEAEIDALARRLYDAAVGFSPESDRDDEPPPWEDVDRDVYESGLRVARAAWNMGARP